MQLDIYFVMQCLIYSITMVYWCDGDFSWVFQLEWFIYRLMCLLSTMYHRVPVYGYLLLLIYRKFYFLLAFQLAFLSTRLCSIQCFLLTRCSILESWLVIFLKIVWPSQEPLIQYYTAKGQVLEITPLVS